MYQWRYFVQGPIQRLWKSTKFIREVCLPVSVCVIFHVIIVQSNICQHTISRLAPSTIYLNKNSYYFYYNGKICFTVKPYSLLLFDDLTRLNIFVDFSRDLEKDIISETSGHFKRLLVSCLQVSPYYLYIDVYRNTVKQALSWYNFEACHRNRMENIIVLFHPYTAAECVHWKFVI